MSGAFVTSGRSGLAYALFPDLDALAGDAREAAPHPAEVWIAERTEQLRAGAYGHAFQRFPVTSGAHALDAAFRGAAELAGRLGIRLPEPEDFLAAGIPLGLPPGTAPDGLIPVPAPHGLGAERWLAAFGDGAADGLPALELATEVVRWFAALDAIQDPALPCLTRREQGRTVRWTLRWFPDASAPQAQSLPLSSDMDPYLPTLPEMLSLDALIAESQAQPVDAGSFGWLAGALPDPRFAARHTHDLRAATIRVSTRERSHSGAHVGVRWAAGSAYFG